MKARMLDPAIVALAVLQTSIARSEIHTFQVDPVHSEVGFTVRHLMSKVRGQFREFEGSINVAENPLESSAEAVIELSSVDTRNNDRDNHLRSGDFFSVESTPKMTFRSTGVRQVGSDLVAEGELTIKDVTKPIEIALEYLEAVAGVRIGTAGSIETPDRMATGHGGRDAGTGTMRTRP